MAMGMQKENVYFFLGFLTRLEIKVERERQAAGAGIRCEVIPTSELKINTRIDCNIIIPLRSVWAFFHGLFQSLATCPSNPMEYAR